MNTGYSGQGIPKYRRQAVNRPLYIETGSPNRQNYPNEVDPGMSGEGWPGPGGRGGTHHMNSGGGRRGGGGNGMHNQRIPQNQHHGGINRMMPPGFRPQQPQFMSPYPPMTGMPGDVMDLNMRMDGMSLASTPTPVMPGQFRDLGPPPVQQWNQPAPFAPQPQQDDLYDPSGYGGNGCGMPPHHQPHMPPYGQWGSGGSQNQYGNRMQQGGNRGYQQRQQGGYMPPMMAPPTQQPYYGGNQANHQQQPPFAPSPSSMSGAGGGTQGGQHEHHMAQNHGQNGNFGVSSSSMDDYSMWTDENDEDAKRKKILRDKGLFAWGDAEVFNSKPIRRWLVPEGHEEDFETAMERCPSHLKKKALNEEALRRRLGSDNPQIVAQAQQQAEEEVTAIMKIGRRPITPCGWGDLETEDFDQGSSKGWDDVNGGRNNQQHQPDDNSQWKNPIVGGPSNSVARNPFFAHHMQQQQQQQHHQHYSQGVYSGKMLIDNGPVWSPVVMDGSSMGPPPTIGGGPSSSSSSIPGVYSGKVLVDNSSMWSPAVMDGSSMGPPPTIGGGSSSSSSSMPMGMLSMAMSGSGGPLSSLDDDGSQKKLAENLRLAVNKGHLDISLLSLPHIPPNVLDLLTEILAVIPRLDGYEEELKKLGDTRHSSFEERGKDERETWMNKDQKNEHDKAVIGVVTAKIEVAQLSKKINEALIDAGLIPHPPQPQSAANTSGHNHHGGPPPGADGAGPSSSRGGDSFNSSGGPPDHYYDYSFLG